MSTLNLMRAFAAGVAAALLVPAASAVAANVAYSLENVIVTSDGVNPTTGTIGVIFSGPAGTTIGAYDAVVLTGSGLAMTGYTLEEPYDAGSPTFDNSQAAFDEYTGNAVYNSPFPTLTGGADVVGRFSFQVPANTIGTFEVNWSEFSSGQEGGGELYDLTFLGGSVTVVVPEPATGLLLLGGGVTMLVSRRRRART